MVIFFFVTVRSVFLELHYWEGLRANATCYPMKIENLHTLNTPPVRSLPQTSILFRMPLVSPLWFTWTKDRPDGGQPGRVASCGNPEISQREATRDSRRTQGNGTRIEQYHVEGVAVNAYDGLKCRIPSGCFTDTVKAYAA